MPGVRSRPSDGGGVSRPDEINMGKRVASRSTASADVAAASYWAGFSYEGLEYTGMVPISRPASLIMAMRRSGSSSGLSSETPMASTVALIIGRADHLPADF